MTAKTKRLEHGIDVQGVLRRNGSDAYVAGGTDVPVTDGGTGASDAATARTNLGAQAADAKLAAIAGLVAASDRMPYFTGVSTAAMATLTAFARTLLDDPDAATARATLGVTSGVTDHGALSGLADDDHPQYAKKADAEAGSTLLYERTASLTTTSTTYAATHQARVGIGGTYTVEFALQAPAGGGGRVYRNGVAVGTERLAPGTYSEDIAGWEGGDLVQIYAKTNNGAFGAGVTNFRIKASALPFYPQQVA